MTTDEWDATDDWRAMLGQFPGIDGSRKLRLWAVAVCRHILDRHARDPISPGHYESAFTGLAKVAGGFADIAELFADGRVSRRELTANPLHSGGPWNVFRVPLWLSRLNAHHIGHTFANFIGEFLVPTDREAADLLRDIFGNPFRPVAFDPRWRCESAVALARTAYESRNFTLLPILADALEEAGCDHADILAHCRGPGPHVRGCWVVDGVLGKT